MIFNKYLKSTCRQNFTLVQDRIIEQKSAYAPVIQPVIFFLQIKRKWPGIFGKALICTYFNSYLSFSICSTKLLNFVFLHLRVICIHRSFLVTIIRICKFSDIYYFLNYSIKFNRYHILSYIFELSLLRNSINTL